MYSGEWKDDERNGEGTFTWADGHDWTGIWVNGKQTYDALAKPTTSSTPIPDPTSTAIPAQ